MEFASERRSRQALNFRETNSIFAFLLFLEINRRRFVNLNSGDSPTFEVNSSNLTSIWLLRESFYFISFGASFGGLEQCKVSSHEKFFIHAFE